MTYLHSPAKLFVPWQSSVTLIVKDGNRSMYRIGITEPIPEI